MNIFYSNVNKKLKEELDLRAQAGRRRSNADLDYMLGKIANVELIAYESGSSESAIVGKLGGDSVSTDARYMPSGLGSEKGFLLEKTYAPLTTISIDPATGLASKDIDTLNKWDESYSIGPYITSAEVTIGDHTMGLLNKATILFTIPNATRDLEFIEDIWFRPGRYVSVKLEYPDSAVISSTKSLDLNNNDFPPTEKLKELYPDLGDRLTSKINEITKMNSFIFEGLITSFDFSYNENGQIDATISLTGTSNVYTDVALYLPGVQTPKAKTPTTTDNITIDPQITPQPANVKPSYTGSGQSTFYDTLYTSVNNDIKAAAGSFTPSEVGCVRFTNTQGQNEYSTDRYIVYGPPYKFVTAYNNSVIQEYKDRLTQLENERSASLASLQRPVGLPINPLALIIQNDFISASKQLEENKAKDLANPPINDGSFFYRYITLGSLIQFINDYPLANISASAPAAKIICDDDRCFSNWLPYITSCMPDAILLLPEETFKSQNSATSPHQYGTDFAYYDELSRNMANKQDNDLKNGFARWPGVLKSFNENDPNTYPDKMYTSRILINLELIRNILLGTDYDTTTKKLSGGLLTESDPGFTLKTFLSAISSQISLATGGVVNLKLVTHPDNIDALMFIDANYVRKTTENTTGTTIKKDPVEPYYIPMLANDPIGTAVKSFKLSATLPESVKNLSYVLNQDPSKISELDIGPYINFMYNSRDVDSYNRLVTEYSDRHKKAIADLIAAREKLGDAPKYAEYIKNLRKCLTTYRSYPTDNIVKTQQLTAPIFPFTAEFTLDGINGFKYGDVLQFRALPSKYTKNTVFSVIGITHTVGSDGKWETAIRTIMRPNIS